jgi:hypothetical protein
LTFPIKKSAAAVALLASGFYLLLSGVEVADAALVSLTAAVLIGSGAISFRTLCSRPLEAAPRRARG